MSLARRLLMGGGGTSFAPPVLTVVTLSSSPNGGWTQIQDPKAIYYNGKTFLGWIDGTSGGTEVASWNHATQALSTPVELADLGTPDNHDSPAVFVRDSDKRILVAYSRHDGNAAYLAVSTNAQDATAFGASTNLDAQLGTDDYTYMCLTQLLAEASDPLYLFYRDYSGTTGRLAYSTSTDGGSTWAARTLLVAGATGKVPYWRLVSNGQDRIDVFITDDSPTDSSLYHFYMSGGNRYKSDGTQITASLPLSVSDLTLVLSNSGGAVWSWGASWDGTRPACVIMRKLSASNNEVLVARWSGSAWTVNSVAETDGVVTGNQYASGAAIDHANPDLVYMARKVGSYFEMYRYTSSDDGVSWQGEAITSGSSADNIWPEVIHDHAADLEAIWLHGTYTSDTSFSFGIKGAGYV